MRFSIIPYFLWILLLLVTAYTPPSLHGQAVTHFMKAEKLRRNDQLEAALAQYDSAISLNPSNHRFYFAKSKCLVFLNREEEAIEALKTVVSLRSDHVEAYTQLAWLYERQRNYASLVQSLEQAAAHQDEDRFKVEYRLRILRTLSLTDNFEQAGPHLERAQALIAPSSANFEDLLYFQAKYLNTQGKYDEAIIKAKEGLYAVESVETRHVAKFYYELGFAYYQKQQYRNARAAFTYAKYDEFEPLIARLSPEYNFALAQAYFRAHLYEDALNAIDKCLAFDKDFKEASELRKQIANRVDNLGAIKVRQNYLSVEVNPERKAEKKAELAELLLGAEKYNQAINAADESLAVKPNNWQTIMVKARALWRMGNLSEAKKQLRKVIDALGTSGNLGGQASFMLGKILLQENNPADARKAFEAAKHGIFYQAAEYELFGLDS